MFGQVVADDTLGDVYVVPLADILDDILEELAATEVRLPESSSEIEALLVSPDKPKGPVSAAQKSFVDSMALLRSLSTLRVSRDESQGSPSSSTIANESRQRGDITSSHSFLTSTGPRKDNDQWFCCQCHHGPNNMLMHAGCAYCTNHWRCKNCIVEKGLLGMSE